MENKIIISSLYLYQGLSEFLIPLADEDGDTDIPVKYETNGWLHFGGHKSQCHCESKQDWEHEVKLSDLRNLRRILKTISDQPLTLSFGNSSNWIVIHSIYV